MITMYVARDIFGYKLYIEEPQFDKQFKAFYGVAWFHLTPDQAEAFADLPAGKCWPVEVKRKESPK